MKGWFWIFMLSVVGFALTVIGAQRCANAQDILNASIGPHSGRAWAVPEWIIGTPTFEALYLEIYLGLALVAFGLICLVVAARLLIMKNGTCTKVDNAKPQGFRIRLF